MGSPPPALRSLAVLLALTLVTLGLALPLGLALVGAAQALADAPTRSLAAALGGATFVKAGLRSLGVAGVVALIALAPAYPLARIAPASLLLALALVSPLARALGVLGLGAAPGVGAVILSQGAGAIPLAALLVQLRLRARDPALLEAAADLGAGPWRRFWAIEAPLCAPAFALAAGVVALTSLGEIASLELAGGGKVYSLALLLRDAVLEDGDAPRSAAIAALLVALAIPCALAIARGLQAMLAAGAATRAAAPGRGGALRIAGAFGLAIATAPLLGLAVELAAAPGPLRGGDRLLLATLPGTLLIGGAVAIAAVLIAAVIAAIERGRDRRVAALLLLPLALPPVVHGALVLGLGRAIGLRPGSTLTFLGLLPARLALAYAGAVVAVALCSDEVRASARDLGAGALARLRRLWIPLVGPALAAVAVVALASAVGEVAVPAFTSGPGGSTLAIAAAIVARGGEAEVVPRWALGLALAGLAAIVLAGKMLSRRTGPYVSGDRRDRGAP